MSHNYSSEIYRLLKLNKDLENPGNNARQPNDNLPQSTDFFDLPTKDLPDFKDSPAPENISPQNADPYEAEITLADRLVMGIIGEAQPGGNAEKFVSANPSAHIPAIESFEIPGAHVSQGLEDDSEFVSREVEVSEDQMLLFEVLKHKEKKPQKSGSWLKKVRGLFVYPVIFVVAFAFFYVLLNFSSLVKQVSARFVKPQDEQILKQDLKPYYTWMEGYFFAVQNRDLLGPNNDIDKDGLTNADEYVMRTNPLIADSDNDGISDGLEIINGANPWGVGAMTEQQKKLSEQLDMIKINNRISYNAAAIVEQSQKPAAKVDYDLNRQGTISIPKLSLQAPITWSKDPSDFDTDLTKGVVHYPGTALPGEIGTMYISGHSSDYLWKHHDFKRIFAGLNGLSAGDDIFVDIYGMDGKTYTFRYRVTEKNIFKPDDQAQFIDGPTAKLNLSTCWPIGTQRDRFVVSSELVPL
ncbi:MAG: sortase domain-bontaining protein [Acidobacteriaceae bacterium]